MLAGHGRCCERVEMKTEGTYVGCCLLCRCSGQARARGMPRYLIRWEIAERKRRNWKATTRRRRMKRRRRMDDTE